MLKFGLKKENKKNHLIGRDDNNADFDNKMPELNI